MEGKSLLPYWCRNYTYCNMAYTCRNGALCARPFSKWDFFQECAGAVDRILPRSFYQPLAVVELWLTETKYSNTCM